MESFFTGVGVVLLIFSIVCLYRAIFGPTVYDRIISINFIGTMTVIILVLIGFIYRRIDMFVDIALTYSLLNFIGTIIVAKYLARRGKK